MNFDARRTAIEQVLHDRHGLQKPYTTKEA